MLPKEPMKNSVFSKNEIGSEILGVSATPTFLTEPNIKRTKIFVTLALFCFISEHHLDGKAATKEVGVRPIHVWWSSPIKIRTQRRFDLVKRNCLRPMLIVVGQDQFIIEHIHGVYKLKSSTIERTDLPSAYFSNTSTTNGAVVGSITSFCAFLSNR